MATTFVETAIVAEELATLLRGVGGLRTAWYVSDVTRPPAAIIGQPDIDFADSQSGFCTAVWLFPITVVVTRNSDRDAQTQMSRLLMEIVAVLATEVPGIFSIEPQDARPTSVTLGGVDLPAYLLNVKVRA